jgi:hypothetical protein
MNTSDIPIPNTDLSAIASNMAAENENAVGGSFANSGMFNSTPRAFAQGVQGIDAAENVAQLDLKQQQNQLQAAEANASQSNSGAGGLGLLGGFLGK